MLERYYQKAGRGVNNEFVWAINGDGSLTIQTSAMMIFKRQYSVGIFVFLTNTVLMMSANYLIFKFFETGMNIATIKFSLWKETI
jgi:hypothetical protein